MPLKNIVIMRKYAHILASLLLLSLILSGVLISSASATGWYDNSYLYRQPINLTGNTSGAQTDYQLLLNVTYNSHIQSDFDDLRFTKEDATTLIDAWLEDKTDGTSADVWVEFLSTPADGVEEIRGYMYYGKADTASDWDIRATMLDGDGFSGSSLDSNIWDNQKCDVNVSGGIVTLDNFTGDSDDTGIKGKRLLAIPYIIESRAKNVYTDTATFIGSSNVWSMSSGDGMFIDLDTSAVYVYSFDNGFDDHAGGDSYTANQYYKLKVVDEAGLYIHGYLDNNEISGSPISTYPPDDSMYLHIAGFAHFAPTIKVDWIFARKYASNSPTYKFGSEEESSAPTYSPPTPTSLTNTTGNFWVNHTWAAGSGNVTDSYNVRVNSVWHNGTGTFYNDTYTAHAWQNITVYAYNNSGALSPDAATQNTQIPNNAITITNTSDWSGNESENVYVDYDATDADSDTPIFSCNQTELFTDFDTATGTGNWTTTYTDSGVYYVDFGVSDGYGSTSNYTMTITVAPHPTPSIIDTNYTISGNDALIIFSSTNTLVTFTATSNQTISYWYWTHATYIDGNGTASSNASHYYGVNGTYYVTVRGEDAAGNFTDTITWQINVGSIGGGTGGGTANGTYALIGTATPLGARKTTMVVAFVLLSGMFMMMLAKIRKEDEQDVT